MVAFLLVHGISPLILASKFKTLKSELKKWNVEVFGNIDN